MNFGINTNLTLLKLKKIKIDLYKILYICKIQNYTFVN